MFQIVLMTVRNSILESSLVDYHMIQSEVSENSCDAHCYDKVDDDCSEFISCI